MTEYSITNLPYKIAVLCYLYDKDNQLLLIHRNKEPNNGCYSPIGGKLEAARGESPHTCAIREIEEEAGVVVDASEIRLFGMLSESAYEGETHWLLFAFEVTRHVDPSEVEQMDMDEGVLEWVHVDEVEHKNIPRTDREIIWDLVRQHRGGFFSVDIDCSSDELKWQVNEEWKATHV